MVANQAQAFGQIVDFYLGPGQEHLPEINRIAKLNMDEADEILLHYVMEAIRNSLVSLSPISPPHFKVLMMIRKG